MMQPMLELGGKAYNLAPMGFPATSIFCDAGRALCPPRRAGRTLFLRRRAFGPDQAASAREVHREGSGGPPRALASNSATFDDVLRTLKAQVDSPARNRRPFLSLKRVGNAAAHEKRHDRRGAVRAEDRPSRSGLVPPKLWRRTKLQAGPLFRRPRRSTRPRPLMAELKNCGSQVRASSDKEARRSWPIRRPKPPASRPFRGGSPSSRSGSSGRHTPPKPRPACEKPRRL